VTLCMLTKSGCMKLVMVVSVSSGRLLGLLELSGGGRRGGLGWVNWTVMVCIGLGLALGLVCLCGTELMGLDNRDWMISNASLLQGADIFTPHSHDILRVLNNHST
jgi:hypothetical protein